MLVCAAEGLKQSAAGKFAKTIVLTFFVVVYGGGMKSSTSGKVLTDDVDDFIDTDKGTVK